MSDNWIYLYLIPLAIASLVLWLALALIWATFVRAPGDFGICRKWLGRLFGLFVLLGIVAGLFIGPAFDSEAGGWRLFTGSALGGLWLWLLSRTALTAVARKRRIHHLRFRSEPEA